MLMVTPTVIPEVLILEYEPANDTRGPSYKNFSKKEMEHAGIHTEFVEEYLYCPQQEGTLYGIHFQNLPKPQAKLVYCTKGGCLDYAVDLRRDSPTYRQWVCVELTPENRRQMYIPAGFGHALLTLKDDTHIVLRIDECFDPALRRAIHYRDETLNIPFPVDAPILSAQDQNAPGLCGSDCNL